jgi:anti-sigma regulatory factor (Ser/Thr protein kinase)
MDVHVSTGRSADLPATPDAPAAIRAFLRAVLSSAPRDATSVVELLASELVSNVVRHVGSPMTVRVGRGDATVRVEVDDEGEDPPVLRHPAPDALGGRGLLLVDTLASEWGWNPHEHGKTVWFVVDLDAEIDIHSPMD